VVRACRLRPTVGRPVNSVCTIISFQCEAVSILKSSMQLSTLDRSNLIRYGCTLLSERNLICMQWGPKPLDVAASASIVVRLIHTEWASGPLLCLAFEISINRALAQYGFLPLDLTNEDHAAYLSRLLTEGKIELSLIGDSDEINRVYQLSARRREGIAELRKRTIVGLSELPAQAYDFEKCVGEFEQRIRLVDYFQYVLTESELRKVIDLSAEKAASVAPEQRAQAAILANELLEVFQPRYDFIKREFFPRLPQIRQSFLFIMDLQKYFQGESEGLTKFLTNIIAAHAPKKDHAQLQTAILLFKSLFRLMDDVKYDAQRGENSRTLESDFREVLGRLAAGQGLSIKALINLVSGIGIPLGGQPGRPPRDYSREYDWKASGISWTAVTRKSLVENPEMRDEFGGRDFDSLDFEQQESLKHRIEVGVKSYAERVGKTFPIERPSTRNKPQEID
jgi:hypothetical protein